MPEISIIVPVYNVETYLSECLDSIVSQTFKQFEVILINDGSKDDSGKICDSYSKIDNRVKVCHIEHGGASRARNIGISLACGKYIGWVDADDRIYPSMFEKLYSLAEHYSSDITECQYILDNGKGYRKSGKEEPLVIGKGDFILKQFFNSQMKPSLWTKIYRREIWNGIYFPEGRKHQDCYVNLRFALMPLIYVRTSEPLYVYVVREKSITTTYTSFEIRQAYYLYEYTQNLALKNKNNIAHNFLKTDAINRFIGRYFEVSVHSRLKTQRIYNRFIWKKLGFNLFKYLIIHDLPLKKRISYILLLLNLKNIQVFMHLHFGKKIHK